MERNTDNMSPRNLMDFPDDVLMLIAKQLFFSQIGASGVANLMASNRRFRAIVLGLIEKYMDENDNIFATMQFDTFELLIIAIISGKKYETLLALIGVRNKFIYDRINEVIRTTPTKAFEEFINDLITNNNHYIIEKLYHTGMPQLMHKINDFMINNNMTDNFEKQNRNYYAIYRNIPKYNTFFDYYANKHNNRSGPLPLMHTPRIPRFIPYWDIVTGRFIRFDMLQLSPTETMRFYKPM